MASTFRYDEDLKRFVEKYPEMARRGNGADIDLAHPRICTRRVYRGLLKLCYMAPRKLAFRLHQQLARIEPMLASI